MSIMVVLGMDTKVNAQKLDFGDAPDSYGTLSTSNGPRHTPFTKVYLGGGLGTYYDAESDGQPSLMADGDDSHDQDGNTVYGQSDEDGLVNGFAAVCLLKDTYKLQIQVYNNSGTDATVSAWIDFNMNGKFDASERTQAVVPTTPNLMHYNGTNITLVWSGLNGLTEGWTYARLRVASNAAEVAEPTGMANSGEVEDYRVQIKNEYDFGDAPKGYGTLKEDGGPHHLINNNLMLLGPLDCSAEEDGQPSDLADGDAGETAVGFPVRLTTKKTAYSVQVNVLNRSGENGMLSGWIDFNRNGKFDPNERAQAIIAADTRNVILSWSGLSGLTEGRTYARFRVACKADEVANPTGFANSGSVEDYTLLIEPPQYDYGDAPDNSNSSYGTLSSSNGARHIYNDVVTNLSLGNYIDAEPDGQPTQLADGDDTAVFPGPFFDDEDGLVTPPALTVRSTSCTATLMVKNKTGVEASVSGWIDFNRNGTFELNERAQATVSSNSFGNPVQITLNWSGLNGLTGGQTYMRLRIASNATEVDQPTGEASDGEVEDYSLMIGQTPMPVNLIAFQGQWLENKGNQLTWVTSWENNNDHFDIQRSADAKSFETIGRLEGKGNSATTQTYEYIDEPGAQAELTYYRLRQVDSDGRLSYSRIVSIRHGIADVLSMIVYPNPATEQVHLQFSNQQRISRVRVYSVSGIQVINQDGAADVLEVGALPAGMYVVEATTASGQVLRQRFVKR